ncbi:dihydrolipoyl dehydrogenase family protein [Synechocystis sp. PCC 7509]|uniref:dihydrolipoyl dehydrogenase family protein n=1 Tax=Synechocystis sp. PCC 7509 TaxID=927677 RepID=UPI0002AC1D08|nr:NAD(P)/FAD-dependent oxidoreductase [Synechocystis sp. PCC 7509]
MADYDLVIIGGSLAGRYAAIWAMEQNKKVALIEPYETTLFNFLIPHALNQLRQNHQQFFIPSTYQTPLSWEEVRQWVKNFIANVEEKYSLAILAALGVDVIVGNAEFSDRQLLIKANNRQLIARSYLIATGAIPKTIGLDASYFTPSNIGQQLAVDSGKNWVIIGNNPDSITWAQILSKLGFKITLIATAAQILPSLDADISYLVEAILEADGVRVLTEKTISQIKELDGKKWIQVGNEAIETDEILVCAGYQPNIKDLRLEAVKVKSYQRGIEVNSFLQTTNPQIYACGEVIGGYSDANINNYEAKIAVNNALLLPKIKTNYQSIPWAIATNPQIAQVGFTETKAKQLYSDNVSVVQHYFKSVAAAQLIEETTGIYKLVVRRNGEILGATIISPQAGELINVMALAIAQKLKIEAISQLFPIYPSFSEIFTFGR